MDATFVSDEIIQKIVNQCDSINTEHLNLQNCLKTLRTEKRHTNLNEVLEAHRKLKTAVDLFKVQYKKQSPKKKRKRVDSSTPSQDEKQSPNKKGKRVDSSTSSPSTRNRHSSGELTLGELKQSIDFSDTDIPSPAALRSKESIEEKIKALFTWGNQSQRQKIRYAFFSDYYIDKYCKSRDISVRALATKTGLPVSELQRKRQLYTDLGKYRAILYSTLSLHRLTTNSSKIREQLQQLPTAEEQKWIHPDSFNSNSFLNCLIQLHGYLPNQVIYECDLYNLNLSEISEDDAINILCITLQDLTGITDLEAFHEALNRIHQQRCMIGYIYTSSRKRNLYEVFGVRENATLAEIGQAFRTLSKKYHPDKNKDEAEQYKELSRAYDALKRGEKELDMDEYHKRTRWKICVKRRTL